MDNESPGFLNNDDDRYIIMGGSRPGSNKYENKVSGDPSFNSGAVKMLSPNLLKGMALDLSLAAEAKNSSRNTDEPDIQEESLQIVFDLPDGSQGESSFKLGQTIEVLKSYIESEYGIPMMEQTLYLEDKVLHNPFSLLDYPEMKGCEEVYVRVEGHLPSFARK